MQYTNIEVPQRVAWMYSGNHVQDVLKAIVGHRCKVVGPDVFDGIAHPAIGYSGIGPWVEGDIDYVDEGLGYTLNYDFIDIDKYISRIFRYEITRQPCFDEQ